MKQIAKLTTAVVLAVIAIVLCLAMQLRAAEDRITQLEAEVALFRDRATRAEGWLQTIHSEIEQKLVAPRSAFGTEQTLVSSNSNTEPSQPPAA
jgi:hypothetical protein